MPDKEQIKKRVGEEAALLIKAGMTIGIGSGSTVFYFIAALAARVKEGLPCKAVPTSQQTLFLAGNQGIPLLTLNDVDKIDLAIDGADEADHQLQLIKGGGGALLQEKMVAAAADRFIVIADNSKLHTNLGSFPLPLEIIPYGWKQVSHTIGQQYGIRTSLRMAQDKAFVSDHGHYILDCYFTAIDNPRELDQALHLIPGVVETGLFVDMCDEMMIGYENGEIKRLYKVVM